MNRKYYFDVIYPFQDRVLKEIHPVKTKFYLTG